MSLIELFISFMIVVILLADASKELNESANTILTIIEMLNIWFRGL